MTMRATFPVLVIAAVAALTVPAAAADVPACDAPGIQATLARLTEAREIPFTRELGFANGTRWCLSSLYFAGGWVVTYTIEPMSDAGRSWVQIRDRYACEFARNDDERALIEAMGPRPVCPALSTAEKKDALKAYGQRRIEN